MWSGEIPVHSFRSSIIAVSVHPVLFPGTGPSMISLAGELCHDLHDLTLASKPLLFVHVKDFLCAVQMAAEHTNVLSLSTEQNDCDAV